VQKKWTNHTQEMRKLVGIGMAHIILPNLNAKTLVPKKKKLLKQNKGKLKYKNKRETKIIENETKIKTKQKIQKDGFSVYEVASIPLI
jgi:hypothetical protein